MTRFPNTACLMMTAATAALLALPAHAEMSPAVWGAVPSRRCRPRARGDEPAGTEFGILIVKSAPRTRR